MPDNAASTQQDDDAFEDCCERIKASVQELDEADRECVQRFFNRFLSDDLQLRMDIYKYPEELEKIRQPSKQMILKMAYVLYHLFYKTYRKDRVKRGISESSCEVLIPYRQSNGKIIQFCIVPKGAKPGDQIVCVYSMTPGPVPPPYMESLVKPLTESKKGEPSLGKLLAGRFPEQKVKQLIQSLGSLNKERLREEIGATTVVGYAIRRLVNEPWIRLPCNNIALRGLWKMAFDDLGVFLDHAAHLEKLVEKKYGPRQITVGQTTIRRNPPDMTLYHALFAWSTCEAFNLMEQDRRDLIFKALETDAVPVTRYYSDREYRALSKRIGDFLKSV